MAKIFIEESTLSAIGDAIRAKTGKTDMISPQNMPTEIASIRAGGGSSTVTTSDVNFYDYDGTLVASYSLSEAQSLTALPDGPTHEGLTFQGWNWTLDAIKALNRPVTVGAMYITDGGATRLHIRIATAGRMIVPLYIGQTVANGVSIDWGDGSAAETLARTGNVNTSHAYAEPGDYTISLMPEDNCTLSFGSGSHSYCVMGSNEREGKVYCNMLQEVSIGKNVISISSYAFENCNALVSIAIPDSVTSISSNAFQNCYGMRYYDFSACTDIPSLLKTDAFNGISSDCQMLIPAALFDAWSTETNWATYAKYMVAV